MSVEHMAMVFAANGLDGSEKLLLLAYTNYTDPHGYCWPGEERLAEDTGTSVSTVRRTKKKLIGKNLVKSVRRPETSNLARVNLPLLASLARPRRAYDDNEVERLSFGGTPAAAPESGPDLRTVQSDLSPSQGSDLRTVQSDLDHRSDCSDGQVNLTCGPAQNDLQSISDPPGDAISRPSIPAAEPSAPTDGGTDGSGSQMDQRTSTARPGAASPGVELLLAIGAERPEFLLSGKPLQDQGLLVTAMLEEGWTAPQLRQIIAGRPLPQPIRTSVGALVARRLRDAVAAPAPGSVPRLPQQVNQGYPSGPADAPTPVAPSWKERQEVWHLDSLPGECSGDGGMCGRPTAPGHDQCVSCLGWGFCGECQTRRVPEGQVCEECTADRSAYAGT